MWVHLHLDQSRNYMNITSDWKELCHQNLSASQKMTWWERRRPLERKCAAHYSSNLKKIVVKLQTSVGGWTDPLLDQREMQQQVFSLHPIVPPEALLQSIWCLFHPFFTTVNSDKIPPFLKRKQKQDKSGCFTRVMKSKSIVSWFLFNMEMVRCENKRKHGKAQSKLIQMKLIKMKWRLQKKRKISLK